MKYSELILALECAGASDPAQEARVILEELFGVSYGEILLDREKEYDFSKIVSVIEKRKEKIPLQYIIGAWYFMGERFAVSPSCLIPRPDTEILVYEALRLLKSEARVADLCTGSGCIGISMLKKRPDIVKMTLADVSGNALDVAKENARALGVYEKCEAVICDVTVGICGEKYDMIVSNPPYIPTKDVSELSEEVQKEPHIALDGGEDGLDIVRPLVNFAAEHLNDGAYLLVEFGYDQKDAICDIMEMAVSEGKYSSYCILKDYGGNDRVLVAQK